MFIFIEHYGNIRGKPIPGEPHLPAINPNRRSDSQPEISSYGSLQRSEFFITSTHSSLLTKSILLLRLQLQNHYKINFMFYVLLLEAFHPPFFLQAMKLLSSSWMEHLEFLVPWRFSWVSGELGGIWTRGTKVWGLRLETTYWIWPYLQPSTQQIPTVLHRMEEAGQVLEFLDLKSGLWKGVGTCIHLVLHPLCLSPQYWPSSTDPHHNPDHGLYLHSPPIHLLSMTIKHCVYYSSSSSDISKKGLLLFVLLYHWYDCVLRTSLIMFLCSLPQFKF